MQVAHRAPQLCLLYFWIGCPVVCFAQPLATNAPQRLIPLQQSHLVRQVSHDTSESPATLPNNHGQVWKQYNIAPYTARVTSPNPEQALVDWILRETGTEIWFAEPLGLLSANRDTLTVYHTREVQTIVSDIVNRFVGTNASDYGFGVRLVTVSSPNWRAKAMPRLQPVTLQSPGMEAWLMSREDAAVVLDDLSKRSDFREHSSPNLVIRNGDAHEITRVRPLAYVKAMNRDPYGASNYRMENGTSGRRVLVESEPLVVTGPDHDRRCDQAGNNPGRTADADRCPNTYSHQRPANGSGAGTADEQLATS